MTPENGYNKSMSDRLPPGQKKTKKFPVLDIGDRPVFDLKTWRLSVVGEVENPLELTFNELKEMPHSASVSDFHCVTRWSRFDNRWGGVLFTRLAEKVKPLDAARFVLFEASGGYTTNLPLEVVMDDDVILADALDGRDLDPAHGGPLRLVVPKRYAYKSIKWLRKIRFLKQDEPGFWEIRGYSNSADPWREERWS